MEEARTRSGGQTGLGARRRYKIAGMLHATYGAGVIAALGDDYFPAGRDLGKSNWNYPMRDGGRGWKFYGKDVTEAVYKQWPLIARELVEGEGAYEWILDAKPDAVVVWNDEYARWRGAVIAGNELKIPTFEICHGSMYLPQIAHWAGNKFAQYQLGSKNYAAWADVMHANGKRIVVGSVEQDPYARAEPDAVRRTARFELQIPDHVPVVCVLTDAPFERSAWQDPQVAYGTTVELLRAVKIAQSIIPGLQLVLKVHPYERDLHGNRIRAADYQRVLEKLGFEHDYAIIDDPMILAIGCADVVAGRPSSAMVSGLMLNIPSVVIADTPFFPRAWFAERGFEVLNTPALLVEKLTELFLEPGRMEGLITECAAGAEWFGGTGDAAWKCADEIRRVLDAGVDRGNNHDDQPTEPGPGDTELP